jgi:hypothetical protein
MKGTDHFKRTIQMFLEQRAAEDELFAKSYRNPAKNIDDCVTYILNYVQKSGCNGFSDGENFSLKIREQAGLDIWTSDYASIDRKKIDAEEMQDEKGHAY